MKKYICIATLILAHTAWSMDQKRHSFKSVNPNNLETMIHSFQTDADRKAGSEILECVLNTYTPSSKTNSNRTNFSPSPLFVIHDKHPGQRPSKL
jgi:hypothetical protein